MIHQDTLSKNNESCENLYGSLSLAVDDDELANVYDVESAESNIVHIHNSCSLESISVICNTVNTLLGVSLFATPWGYEESGLAGGSLILLVVAFLSYETARILLLVQKLYYQRTGEIRGYPEIAEAALGRMWCDVVKVATIISCLGGCTGYLIFFGETVGQVFSLSSESVVLAATMPLILLSWIRSFRELTLFTVFGVMALLVAIVVILIDGSHQYQSGEAADTPIFRPQTSFNFLGPATFMFTIHYCLLSMGAEALHSVPVFAVSHPSSLASHYRGRSLSTVSDSAISAPSISFFVGVSYFVSLLVIGLLGSSAFIMYRTVDFVRDHNGDIVTGCEDHVCQNVILNLSPGAMRSVVGLTMSLVIVLSYILLLVPAREHIEGAMLRLLHPGLENEPHVTARNLLRTLLVLSTVVVAVGMPYFGTVLGAIGGFTDALQCFVLPPLIYMRVFGRKIHRTQKALYCLLVLAGVTTMVYTCVNTYREITEQ